MWRLSKLNRPLWIRAFQRFEVPSNVSGIHQVMKVLVFLSRHHCINQFLNREEA